MSTTTAYCSFGTISSWKTLNVILQTVYDVIICALFTDVSCCWVFYRPAKVYCQSSFCSLCKIKKKRLLLRNIGNETSSHLPLRKTTLNICSASLNYPQKPELPPESLPLSAALFQMKMQPTCRSCAPGARKSALSAIPWAWGVSWRASAARSASPPAAGPISRETR